MAFRFLCPLVLLAAALDSGLAGAWLLGRPRDLGHFLRTDTPPDALFFLRILGLLLVCHAPLLLLAAFRPYRYRGLIMVPLAGRALLVGLWCWLLGSHRIHPSVESLRLLIAHDGLWIVLLTITWVCLKWTAGREMEPASGRS